MYFKTQQNRYEYQNYDRDNIAGQAANVYDGDRGKKPAEQSPQKDPIRDASVNDAKIEHVADDTYQNYDRNYIGGQAANVKDDIYQNYEGGVTK